MIDFVVPRNNLFFGGTMMVNGYAQLEHFHGNMLGHLLYRFGCREYDEMRRIGTVRYSVRLTRFTKRTLPLYWIYRMIPLSGDKRVVRLPDRDYVRLWAMSIGEYLENGDHIYRYQGRGKAIEDAAELLSKYGINFKVE